MKKVWTDPGCISCGSCEYICPEVFKVVTVSQVNPDADIVNLAPKIKEAAKACPVQVIKYEE